MSTRKLITDKIISDWEALTFDGGGSLLGSVQKYYTSSYMNGNDLMLMYDDVATETIGITTDEREYGFQSIYIEEMESSISQNEADTRLDRMAVVEDKIFDYLQAQPNNLRQWGFLQSPQIEVVNIVARPAIYDDLRGENGFVKVQRIRFSVIVSINTRSL